MIYCCRVGGIATDNLDDMKNRPALPWIEAADQPYSILVMMMMMM